MKPEGENISNLSQKTVLEHEDATEIRVGLARILDSSAFAKSDRLQDFLSYIVEESLAGRGDLIVGKSIAADVYGRTPENGSDNIVRVDARRLRRHLSDYYASEGKTDPLRVYVDSGGYAPRFEIVNPVQHNDNLLDTPALPQSPVQSSWLRWRVALLAVAGLLVILIYSAQDGFSVDPKAPIVTPENRRASERSALAEHSVATLQASNLSEKATELLFPIADVEHQNLATTMYRKAIEIDPGYSAAYAGAAHSLATLSLLSPNSELRSSFLAQASEMADMAIKLAPASGWAQSGAAWVAYVSGDHGRAIELSQRSVSLNKFDNKTVEFHGLISLVTGNFEEALQATNPTNLGDREKRSPAYLNVFGVANFHMGNYQTALTAIDRSIKQGGPVSELTLTYKAASHHASGNLIEAQKLVDELKQTWPNFRLEPVLKRFYQHPEHVEQVLVQVRPLDLH